jgi:hypothetical protein
LNFSSKANGDEQDVNFCRIKPFLDLQPLAYNRRRAQKALGAAANPGCGSPCDFVMGILWAGMYRNYYEKNRQGIT